MTIFDVKGQKMEEVILMEQNTRISLEDFVGGSYFYEIGDGSTLHFKGSFFEKNNDKNS